MDNMDTMQKPLPALHRKGLCRLVHPPRFERGISGFGGRRLIHWATGAWTLRFYKVPLE